MADAAPPKLEPLLLKAYTAQAIVSMQDRLEELGAAGLLTKPYGRDELLQVIGSKTQA